MVVVTIEMWPQGKKEKAYKMAEAVLTNDGTGTKSIGHYDCIILDKKGKKVKRTRVAGFPRTRVSVWILLLRMIQQTYGHG